MNRPVHQMRVSVDLGADNLEITDPALLVSYSYALKRERERVTAELDRRGLVRPVDEEGRACGRH